MNQNAVVENRDRVFQGSVFLGDGFLLTHDDAMRIRAHPIHVMPR